MICRPNMECLKNKKSCLRCVMGNAACKEITEHTQTLIADAVLRLLSEGGIYPHQIRELNACQYDQTTGGIILDMDRIYNGPRKKEADIRVSEDTKAAVNSYIEEDLMPLIDPWYEPACWDIVPLFLVPCKDGDRELLEKDVREMVYEAARTAGYDRRWIMKQRVKYLLHAVKNTFVNVRRNKNG